MGWTLQLQSIAIKTRNLAYKIIEKKRTVTVFIFTSAVFGQQDQEVIVKLIFKKTTLLRQEKGLTIFKN